MKNPKKIRTRKQSRKAAIILIVVFLSGLAIFSYPFISNRLAQWRQGQYIGDYMDTVNGLSADRKAELWVEAEEYNNALIGQPVKDPFIMGSGAQLPQNYLEILNATEVMAYIEIPRISVKLPIYHGVSDEVLENGVGHMEGTSFPIGGSGTHCLLTGHTGLPEAKLFTDLTELEVGDQFYITVLDTELVYQVDQIEIIEPDELGSLYTEVGEDYVTLITCTPYGVNSHRLLVRGTRVDQMVMSIELSQSVSWAYRWLFGISALMTIILAGICLRKRRIRKPLIAREKQRK